MQNCVLRLLIQADKLFYMAVWPHMQNESHIEAVSRMWFWIVTLIFFAYYTTWKLVLPLQKCYFDIWHAFGRHFRTLRRFSCDFLCPRHRILHALGRLFSTLRRFSCDFLCPRHYIWHALGRLFSTLRRFSCDFLCPRHYIWHTLDRLFSTLRRISCVYSAHSIIFGMP